MHKGAYNYKMKVSFLNLTLIIVYQYFMCILQDVHLTETSRFLEAIADQSEDEYLKQVTDWEQREYFELF